MPRNHNAAFLIVGVEYLLVFSIVVVVVIEYFLICSIAAIVVIEYYLVFLIVGVNLTNLTKFKREKQISMPTIATIEETKKYSTTIKNTANGYVASIANRELGTRKLSLPPATSSALLIYLLSL